MKRKIMKNKGFLLIGRKGYAKNECQLGEVILVGWLRPGVDVSEEAKIPPSF